VAMFGMICLPGGRTSCLLSAPSERVFSMASRIINNRCNRLDPTITGKMHFVSENWKWWQDQLDFHKATEDDDEAS
jgi:hypothetical protein